MELTTEDRERIEQEIDRILIERGEHQTRVRNPLYGEERELTMKVAEYATIYERTHILNRIVLAEAEHSEVIRRIKSILKASTVHDKISILEELEQLLNSLKTK